MKYLKWVRIVGLVALMLITTVSCATLFTKGGSDYRQANSAYQQQEYVDAMTRVLSALEKNPEFEEALALYPQIYQDGSAYYLSIAQQQGAATDPDLADAAYLAYQNLVSLNTTVDQSGRNDIATTDYTAEVEVARVQMLDAHYENGIALLATGGIAQARQAYLQFQFVLNREQDYRDAETKAAEAVEAGTVHIAVAAGTPGTDGVAETYHRALRDALGASQFIDVASIDAYRGSSMASPLDAMFSDLSAGNLDYVIQISPSITIEATSDSSSDGVPVTVDYPISDDGYYFTRGYRATYSLGYAVTGPGMERVDEGTLIEDTKQESITVYKIMGELHQDINFGDGTGAHNIVVAEVEDEVNGEVLFRALADVREATNIISAREPRFAELDQMGWKDYFLRTYPTLAELKAEYENAYFSDAPAVFEKATGNYFFIFGETITESIEGARHSSAMYQGIARASTQLAEEAAGEDSNYHSIMASALSDYVAARF